MISRYVVLFTLLLISNRTFAQACSPPQMPGPTPTAFSVPLDDWGPWLAAVKKLGPSKDKKGLPNPAPPAPPTFGKNAPLACAAINPEKVYCYSCPTLAAAQVTGVTDDQRKNFLKYYLVRYGLDDPTKLDALFAAPSGGSATCTGATAKGAPAPNSNVINAYAARARHKLNNDIANFTCLANAPNTIASVKLSNQAIASTLTNQLYLIDYMFPDAALWEIVLIKCVASPPPGSPVGSCNGIYL